MQQASARGISMPTKKSRISTGTRNWSVMLMLATLCSFPARSQSAPALPVLGADQIVQRLIEKNKERADCLQHYSGTRSYRLEYRGFPAPAVATMQVQVQYDAPSTKRFTVISSTGPNMLQNRVFQRLLEGEQQAGDASNKSHSELGPDNYAFSLAGTDSTNYILNVEPKVESKFLYRGKIWVDAHDFAVTRIEAQPARNPSFWTTKSMIHHTYQKVDGGFYLPKENKTVTSVRLGGTATLTIEYESFHMAPSTHIATARKPATSTESSVWPGGGFTEEVASFATGKK
jgi:hypothetical protein